MSVGFTSAVEGEIHQSGHGTSDLNVCQLLVKENGIRDNDANGVGGGVASLCETPNACPGHKA
eukprot:scaffold75237_cov72-Attheya_sp.AAC.1